MRDREPPSLADLLPVLALLPWIANVAWVAWILLQR